MSASTKPRVLITGASGSYARMLTRRILELDVSPLSLILVSRTPDSFSAPPGASKRQGSFDDDLSSLTTAFQGAEVVFLISTSRAGARLPQHQNAINAAKAAGAKHIIYTSSIGASNPNHTALVVREHAATEAMLRASGLYFTCLRDSTYAEAIANVLLPPAIASGVLKTNAGTGTIAPVSKVDCVEVAAHILASPSSHQDKVYDITGPELLSFADIRAMAEKRFGKKLEFVLQDDEQTYSDYDAMGVPRHPSDEFERDGVNGFHWNSSDMVSYGAAMRGGEMAVLSNCVFEITGRKPISLADVLERSRGSE